MSAPIVVRCEGSGAKGHPWNNAGMCPMCGGVYPYLDNFIMPDHDRKDVLAMLARGDFG